MSVVSEDTKEEVALKWKYVHEGWLSLVAKKQQILWQSIKLHETGSCFKMNVWTFIITLGKFSAPISKTGDLMAEYQLL